MDISVIFPLRDLSKMKSIIDSLEDFSRSHNVKEYIFVSTGDRVQPLSDKVKIVLIDKYSINNAVEAGLRVSTGDVVLIGDSKTGCNEVFERMLEKHQHGANVVGVYKERNWLSNMFFEMGVAITNFFTKMYTDKNDTFCYPSLQLLDRNVVDLINTLPNKSGLIRHSDNLIGVEYAYIPLSAQYKCEKNNYNDKSVSSILAYSVLGVFFLSVLAIIFSNIFARVPVYANVIMGVVGVLTLVTFVLAITKHVLDVRMTVGSYKIVDTIFVEPIQATNDSKPAKKRSASSPKTSTKASNTKSKTTKSKTAKSNNTKTVAKTSTRKKTASNKTQKTASNI